MSSRQEDRKDWHRYFRIHGPEGCLDTVPVVLYMCVNSGHAYLSTYVAAGHVHCLESVAVRYTHVTCRSEIKRRREVVSGNDH